MTISDFASAAILEKIEDSYDLEALRQASAEDSGKRFDVIRRHDPHRNLRDWAPRHDKAPVSELTEALPTSVELAGIEPASSSAVSGLLRVQFVVADSRPRCSHEHVTARLSRV